MNVIKLKQLTDREGNNIAPITPEAAVYDNNGIRLSDKLLAITNPADEEDITLIQQNNKKVLKLKDRNYNFSNFSGKGYKILRKNITNGKNILLLELINDSNTVYEIRYDFDLNKKNIIIPKDCILFFNGGTLNNGIITGNNTCIIFNNINFIFYNIQLLGNFNSKCYSSWFSHNNNNDNIVWENLLKFENAEINSDLEIDCMSLSNNTTTNEKLFKLNGNNFTVKFSFTKEAYGISLLSFNSKNIILENINFTLTNTLDDFNNGKPYGTAFYLLTLSENVITSMFRNINCTVLYDRFLGIDKNVTNTIIKDCHIKTHSFAIEGFGEMLKIESSILEVAGNNRYGWDILSSASDKLAKVYICNSRIIGGIEFVNGSLYVDYSILSIPSFGERSDSGTYLNEVIFNYCNFIGFGDNVFLDDCYLWVRSVHNLIFNNCTINCKAAFNNIDASRDFTYLRFKRIDYLEFNYCTIKLYEVPKHGYWNPELRIELSPIVKLNGCHIINGSGILKQLLVIIENLKNTYSNIVAEPISFIDKNIVLSLSDSTKLPIDLFNSIARVTSNIQTINSSGTFENRPSNNIELGLSYYCTDRLTTEGSRNGIIIYYAGDDIWTDALGRIIE